MCWCFAKRDNLKMAWFKSTGHWFLYDFVCLCWICKIVCSFLLEHLSTCTISEFWPWFLGNKSPTSNPLGLDTLLTDRFQPRIFAENGWCISTNLPLPPWYLGQQNLTNFFVVVFYQLPTKFQHWCRDRGKNKCRSEIFACTCVLRCMQLIIRWSCH